MNLNKKKNKVAIIIDIANRISLETENFQMVRGAGAGNHATNSFMNTLRSEMIKVFEIDYSEKRISGKNSFAVDFFIPEEKSIVEVALGLPNTASEFEKDILKAIMAKELKVDVQKLVFISRPGAIKKCSQPGRKAIQEWAKNIHGLEIEIIELPGEPRIRKIKKLK